MNCPVCGYTTTRVNDTYWCPNDRIYIGKTLTAGPPLPLDNPSYTPANFEVEPGRFAKFFDKFLWVLMGVLYLVVVAFIAWSFLNGAFDNSPIFSN